MGIWEFIGEIILIYGKTLLPAIKFHVYFMWVGVEENGKSFFRLQKSHCKTRIENFIRAPRLFIFYCIRV